MAAAGWSSWPPLIVQSDVERKLVAKRAMMMLTPELREKAELLTLTLKKADFDLSVLEQEPLSLISPPVCLTFVMDSVVPAAATVIPFARRATWPWTSASAQVESALVHFAGDLHSFESSVASNPVGTTTSFAPEQSREKMSPIAKSWLHSLLAVVMPPQV